MYIGHFAAALALRGVAAHDRRATTPSLAALFLGAQALDILFAGFFVAGLEVVRYEPDGPAAFPYLGSYPWSHSLVAALFWSALLGGAYLAWSRNSRAGALIALSVFSHWILDFVSHAGDMQLLPTVADVYGLGLSRSVIGISVTELALFLGALTYYMHSGAQFNRRKLAQLSAFLILTNGLMVMPFAHTRDTTFAASMGILFPVLAYWAWRVEKKDRQNQ